MNQEDDFFDICVSKKLEQLQKKNNFLRQKTLSGYLTCRVEVKTENINIKSWKER